jgi:hypothetical protein
MLRGIVAWRAKERLVVLSSLSLSIENSRIHDINRTAYASVAIYGNVNRQANSIDGVASCAKRYASAQSPNYRNGSAPAANFRQFSMYALASAGWLRKISTFSALCRWAATVKLKLPVITVRASMTITLLCWA